ncbi:hypothetical protein EGI22_06995 [Lacihabitans sp. LS3-19]|uniref:hypothetical protein n=1 Tax=Lacihabitans sp. LS3-19 TaxID=2487335 RepID=UPI0020CEFBB8|nr:hypothetical protein [Lacihabitans sp. LS3-19]MCP9767654.1 hypothetical protein [Lacihabitans sp. LS3-19]
MKIKRTEKILEDAKENLIFTISIFLSLWYSLKRLIEFAMRNSKENSKSKIKLANYSCGKMLHRVLFDPIKVDFIGIDFNPPLVVFFLVIAR